MGTVMDESRKKVTAKFMTPEHPVTAASLVAQPIIRAKVSGTARTRTRTASSISSFPSQAPTNDSLRPIDSVKPRRSPSPSKMFNPGRSAHPTPSRSILVGERVRGSSISSVVSLHQSSGSTPSTSRIQPTGDASHVNLFPATTHSRVKAKVSGLVKPKPSSSTPSTPISGAPPLFPATSNPRPRSPTLNVHPRSTYSTKPPPAQLVPLPTSPPASTLSFSSTSTSSQSQDTSVSTTPSLIYTHTESASTSVLAEGAYTPPKSSPTPQPPPRELVARVPSGVRISVGHSNASGSASSSSRIYTCTVVDDTNEFENRDDEDDDKTRGESRSGTGHKLDEERAEAKSNRKIADLEITTQSLLAINTSLEAAKVRQAREIRELRRRLRETRLILPPRAFRQLREKDDPPPAESEDEESEEDYKDGDETFTRLCDLVEGLLDSGRKALAVAYWTPRSAGSDGGSVSRAERGDARMGQPEVLGWESGGKHGVAIGSRVLSPEEVGLWAGEREGMGEEWRGTTPEPSRHGEDGQPDSKECGG